jgi:hypothetical protein
MKGHEAFDWLVEQGYMRVNDLGFGEIVKPPKRSDLDMFVKAVRVLGAYRVSIEIGRSTIETTCGCRVNDLRFKKHL